MVKGCTDGERNLRQTRTWTVTPTEWRVHTPSVKRPRRYIPYLPGNGTQQPESGKWPTLLADRKESLRPLRVGGFVRRKERVSGRIADGCVGGLPCSKSALADSVSRPAAEPSIPLPDLRRGAEQVVRIDKGESVVECSPPEHAQYSSGQPYPSRASGSISRR